MYTQGSVEFNQIIETPNNKAIKSRLVLLDDNTIIDKIKSLILYSASCSQELQIGTTNMAYIDAEVESDLILTNREVRLECGVELSDGTVEYIPMGVFTIQKPQGDIDFVKFTANDRMQKFDYPYSSALTYPTTDKAMLEELATMCGVTLATNIDNPITIDKALDGYTRREVLGYIAGLHGEFACFNRDGELELKWYNTDSPITKNIGLIWGFEKSDEDFTVSKIEVAKNNETTLTSGNGYGFVQHSNPLATQEIVNDLFTSLNGFTYNASVVDILDDIRLDLGDVIKVTYLDGKDYLVPCMSIKQDFTQGSTNIESFAKSDTENTYRFTGPTIQYLNRMAMELLVANRVIATKVDAEYVNSHAITTDNLDAIKAEIQTLIVDEIDGKYATIDFANIDVANIDKTNIGLLFAEVGLIDRATIVDGHITGFLDAVEINANKITAGTLVADRILLSGEEGSVLFALNNLGELVSTNVDTLDGYILTDRTITADKIIAKSITTNELDVNQIFGNEAVLNKLVSQEIFSDAVATNTVVVGASKDAKDALDLANSTNTASGSPILLADSADGTLIDFKAYGRSTQDGTPTPNSPQAIKSVADGGYFDGELLQGYRNTSGVFVSANAYVTNKNLIPCNANDEIKLVYEEAASALGLYFFDKNRSYISQYAPGNTNEASTTAPTNAKYFSFIVNNSGLTVANAKHITVTINGKYAYIVKSKGKNILDISHYRKISGVENVTLKDNIFTISKGNNTYGIMFPNIDVGLKVGKTYAFSARTISGSISGGYRLHYSDNTYSKTFGINVTFTPEKEVSDVLFYVGMPYTGDANIVFTDLQIEENTVVTDYEPYKETVTYIPLNEPLRSSLDESVRDVVSLTGVTRNFKEVIFDGSADEGWTLNGYATNNDGVNISLFQRTDSKLPIVTARDTVKRVISDKLIATSRSNEQLANSCCVANNQRLFICLEGTIPLADFKAQLQANPITVVYELAEPIVEAIEPVDIVTYDNVTYLTASDDAEMWVEYYRNTPTGIQLAKLSTIEQDNNRILANWASDNDITLIDGAKIYTGSITADKINVNDLFAQDITATGTITGAHLISNGTTTTTIFGSGHNYTLSPINWGWSDSGTLVTGIEKAEFGAGYFTLNELIKFSGKGFDYNDTNILAFNTDGIYSPKVNTENLCAKESVSTSELQAGKVVVGAGGITSNGKVLVLGDIETKTTLPGTTANIKCGENVYANGDVIAGYGTTEQCSLLTAGIGTQNYGEGTITAWDSTGRIATITLTKYPQIRNDLPCFYHIATYMVGSSNSMIYTENIYDRLSGSGHFVVATTSGSGTWKMTLNSVTSSVTIANGTVYQLKAFTQYASDTSIKSIFPVGTKVYVKLF